MGHAKHPVHREFGSRSCQDGGSVSTQFVTLQSPRRCHLGSRGLGTPDLARTPQWGRPVRISHDPVFDPALHVLVNHSIG